MMVTSENIPADLELIKEHLASAAKSRPIHLELQNDDLAMDDGWLYVPIQSTTPGERPSDYADLMHEIELELRESDMDNVLLIPVLPEFLFS